MLEQEREEVATDRRGRAPAVDVGPRAGARLAQAPDGRITRKILIDLRRGRAPGQVRPTRRGERLHPAQRDRFLGASDDQRAVARRADQPVLDRGFDRPIVGARDAAAEAQDLVAENES
jgi:hypothetical protein